MVLFSNYIDQNTLACKILGIFTVGFFRYICPQRKMNNNDCHGCTTQIILSIVLCTFVKHNIPLQKAHITCNMVNVKNNVKVHLTETSVPTKA